MYQDLSVKLFTLGQTSKPSYSLEEGWRWIINDDVEEHLWLFFDRHIIETNVVDMAVEAMNFPTPDRNTLGPLSVFFTNFDFLADSSSANFFAIASSRSVTN